MGGTQCVPGRGSERAEEARRRTAAWSGRGARDVGDEPRHLVRSLGGFGFGLENQRKPFGLGRAVVPFSTGQKRVPWAPWAKCKVSAGRADARLKRDVWSACCECLTPEEMC